MNIWLIVLGAGCLTLGLRLSFALPGSAATIPPIFQRALRFMPVSLFTALILPDLFIRHGSLDMSLGNFRLIAGCIATVVAWHTQNLLLTILAGLGCLLLLQGLG